MRRSTEDYLGMLGQRGIEVADPQVDDYGMRITSTSPLGKGEVLVRPVEVKDPWTKRTESRLPHYRVIYIGDGDWLRLARSSALDGLLWAYREDAAAIEVYAGDVFGDVSTVSGTVYVRIDPGDLDQPLLERIHEVEVFVGGWSFPLMYLTPPFGIKDLERRVEQVLTYAPLDRVPSSHRCPECGTETSLKMLDRLRLLQTLKTDLCPDCLAKALICGGPALPIEPKGWRR